MEAATVACVFVDTFISRYGAPVQLHTDQGRQIESHLFQQVCHLLGIRKTRTTAYHPQSDGASERLIRTLLGVLRRHVDAHANDWDLHLPLALMAIRSSVHSSTGVLLYLAMFGRDITLPLDVMYGTPNRHTDAATTPSAFASSLRSNLVDIHHLIRTSTDCAHSTQQRIHDDRRKEYTYRPGDRVWLFLQLFQQASLPSFIAIGKDRTLW